jgi:hypothetical protein
MGAEPERLRRAPHEPASPTTTAQTSTASNLRAPEPIRLVLERLNRVRRSGEGWVARCPAHEDRSPSLSVREGNDGRALVHCHAGCDVTRIVSALGLELTDLFPPKDERFTIPPRPSPVVLPRSVAQILVESSEFAIAWEISATLALLPGRAARVEVLRNWGYLTSRCDVQLLLRTAYLIRGIAVFRYCNSDTVNDPKAIQRAVRRLCEEVSRGAARAA